MIQLHKSDEPQVLVDNKVGWTDEFRRLRAGEDVPAAAERRYAHDDVREALRRETSAKCAYCEAKILHVSYDHIEHILPKVQVPELVCEWSNLTLACQVCNTTKGDYHNPVRPLLHPYNDAVHQEIRYFGPWVADGGTVRSEDTIREVGLDRDPLTDRRREFVTRLNRLLESERAATGDAKALLQNEIASLQEPEAEFSSVARHFVAHHRATVAGQL